MSEAASDLEVQFEAEMEAVDEAIESIITRIGMMYSFEALNIGVVGNYFYFLGKETNVYYSTCQETVRKRSTKHPKLT